MDEREDLLRKVSKIARLLGKEVPAQQIEQLYSKLFTTVPNSLLLPVEYSDILPIEKVAVDKDGKIEADQSKMKLLLPALLKSLAIKSDIWNYEREWRHIIFTKDMPDRLACLPIISRIILGINISTENREKMHEFAKERHIPVSVVSMKPDKYEMVLSNLG